MVTKKIFVQVLQICIQILSYSLCNTLNMVLLDHAFSSSCVYPHQFYSRSEEKNDRASETTNRRFSALPQSVEYKNKAVQSHRKKNMEVRFITNKLRQ